MEEKDFEPAGLIPRSIIRTVERFQQQLRPETVALGIQEFRISRYQVRVSVRYFFILLLLPITLNWGAKNLIIKPLVSYFWNTYQTSLFLNNYQAERAFQEMRDFESQLFFEMLLLPEDPKTFPLSSKIRNFDEKTQNHRFSKKTPPSLKEELVENFKSSEDFYINLSKNPKGFPCRDLKIANTNVIFKESVFPLRSQKSYSHLLSQQDSKLKGTRLTSNKPVEPYTSREQRGLDLTLRDNLSKSFSYRVFFDPSIEFARGGFETSIRNLPQKAWQSEAKEFQTSKKLNKKISGEVWEVDSLTSWSGGLLGAVRPQEGVGPKREPTYFSPQPQNGLGPIGQDPFIQVNLRAFRPDAFVEPLVLAKGVEPAPPGLFSSTKFEPYTSEGTPSFWLYDTNEPFGSSGGLPTLTFNRNKSTESLNLSSFTSPKTILEEEYALLRPVNGSLQNSLALLNGPTPQSQPIELCFRAMFQKKTALLAETYNQQSITALSNMFGDCIMILSTILLIRWNAPQFTILKSFLIESFYSFNDAIKCFYIILITDFLVGFHSPRGWEIVMEILLRHLGLPENEEFILLFVGTFPVFLDTAFKYWIFRYLNKISPSTVATYHNMIE